MSSARIMCRRLGYTFIAEVHDKKIYIIQSMVQNQFMAYIGYVSMIFLASPETG